MAVHLRFSPVSGLSAATLRIVAEHVETEQVMSTVVSTKIDIAASPQAVWEVLTDFAAYPDRNPFMRRIEGSLGSAPSSSCT
jgi:hypothetical protein